MKNYEEEFALSHLYQKEFNQGFESINHDQEKQLRKIASDWYAATRRHPYLHNSLNMMIIISMIAADYFLWRTSYFWLIFFGHGFITYSLSTFTIHEGSGHNMIILGKSRLAKFGQLLANNTPRLFFNDPGFYGPIHVHHHKDFGTKKDAAYTNYVLSNRLVKCLMPLAGILPFNDYKIHGDTKFTKSQALSNTIGLIYTIIICRPFAQLHGRLFFILLFLACGQLSFLLDRMRESTEHHLMPENEMNGARNFGITPTSMIIGGGPWGQPCHLSHHVHPSLPWYWQCLLHFKIKNILNAKQRKQFLYDKFLDYPKLVFTIIKERHKVEARYKEIKVAA